MSLYPSWYPIAGRLHVVLVEGESRRSKKARAQAALLAEAGNLDLPQTAISDFGFGLSAMGMGTARQLQGRTDTNKRAVFEDVPVPIGCSMLPMLGLQFGCSGVGTMGSQWQSGHTLASLPTPAFSPNIAQVRRVSDQHIHMLSS